MLINLFNLDIFITKNKCILDLIVLLPFKLILFQLTLRFVLVLVNNRNTCANLVYVQKCNHLSGKHKVMLIKLINLCTIH